MIEHVGMYVELPVSEFEALRVESDYLREVLMRVGLLAVSERQDGCISKTAALRIRKIAHRACWPAEGEDSQEPSK